MAVRQNDLPGWYDSWKTTTPLDRPVPVQEPAILAHCFWCDKELHEGHTAFKDYDSTVFCSQTCLIDCALDNMLVTRLEER